MSVQSVLVIAAVPLPADVGLEERRSAFWLSRLFGSGRKRKLSRDIGTSITEEQLYLESPPVSPGTPGTRGSPRSPRSPAATAGSPVLPDLVTSCNLRPPRAPPTAAVFVFPEVGGAAAGPPPEPSAELRNRLAGLDGLDGAGVTPPRAVSGGGGPAAPAPADAEMLEVGRCLRRCADEFELSRRAAARSTAAARPLRVERLAVGALVAATAVCVCRRLCK